MRTDRLVSGDFLDRPQILSAAPDETGRPLFHMDVSHIRDGCLSGSHRPAAAEKMLLGTRRRLYLRHFPHGIPDRKLSEKTRYVPLGLQPGTLQYPRHHPAGLCSRMVPDRPSVRKDSIWQSDHAADCSGISAEKLI